MEKLKIKTNIQRSDSTLISSNIRKYSRVQPLIEVLLRLSRLFDPDDKDALSELIKPYSKLESEKYIYQLKSSDLTHELKKLGELYYDIYEYVKIKCPYQKVKSTPTKKRNKAVFDTKKCNVCLLKEECNILKNKRKYYFTHSDYLKSKRNNNILKIPEERRKLRPNVEATMNEFKAKTRAGKLKVRGLFKTSLFAFLRIK